MTVRAVVPALLAAFLAYGPVPASAQAPGEPGPLAAIGADLWKQGTNCSECHGIMGNGVAEDPRSPAGANFRETTLDAALIADIIRCGLPGTGMPYFVRNAYAGQNPCYGTTLEALGTQAPPSGTPQVNARQSQALAQFILWKFAGKGEPTREECLELWGEGATLCSRYPGP